jgi:hypothetical protein
MYIKGEERWTNIRNTLRTTEASTREITTNQELHS